MISIRMLKLCGNSTWRPLQIIFKKFLKGGILPDEGKKVTIVPIHDKKRWIKIKKWISSDCPTVSLLQVCSNIFERLIYNSMYKHITLSVWFSHRRLMHKTTLVNYLKISFILLTKSNILRHFYSYWQNLAQTIYLICASMVLLRRCWLI